jgi:hypothetical protein
LPATGPDCVAPLIGPGSVFATDLGPGEIFSIVRAPVVDGTGVWAINVVAAMTGSMTSGMIEREKFCKKWR